jgi:hypothetical protein
MISRRIHCKQGNDNYRRLARYISDASHKGEKCLAAWSAKCWADDDYDLGIKEVEATQSLNTRTTKEKTYHLILSFRPEDEARLTTDDFKDIEKEFAKSLGFEHHQRHCGVHQNTNNIHMHVAYNMIHPEKLIRVEPYRDYYKRDEVCRKMERKYGLQIDLGRDLNADPKRPNEKASTYEAQSGQQSFDSYAKEKINFLDDSLQNIKSWERLHEKLAEFGLSIELQGNGCVIKDSFGKNRVKASAVKRTFSKPALEKRLGEFCKHNDLTTVLVKERYGKKPLQRHAKTDALFLEFSTAMNAPRDTGTSNWNKYLQERAEQGDTDALDILRSKPQTGSKSPAHTRSTSHLRQQAPDYSDPIVLEKFMVTAFNEITGRIGIFELNQLNKEMVQYANLRNVKVEEQKINFFLASPTINDLLTPLPGSDPQKPTYTLKALLQAEADNQLYLTQGQNKYQVKNKALLESKIDDTAQQLFNFSFGGEQRQAALGILSSEDFITCVQGDPGTGKTTMLQAVVETHGKDQIIGLSTAGVAAKKLGDETGARSMTIARFCIDYERRLLALETDKNEQILHDTAYIDTAFSSNNGILIVDEASMTSSLDANKLCRIAAKENAKLVLVGDTKQLPGVGAGKPFDLWQQQGATTFRLSEIRRQKDFYEREAVKSISLQADVRSALNFLTTSEESFVQEVPKKEERVAAIINEYMRHYDRTGMQPLLITSLNKDRMKFNELIRSQLKNRGIVSCNEQMQDIELPTGEKQKRNMAVGDEIILMRKLPGTDVVNGTRASITNLEGNEYTIKLEDGNIIKFNGESFRHFDHAYSLSTYKGQGQSVDSHVIYHAPSYSPLLTRNEFLVGISRNKNHVSVYTDNKTKMIAKAEKQVIKPTALETFERGVMLNNASTWLKHVHNAAFDFNRSRETVNRHAEQAGDWSVMPPDQKKRLNEFQAKAKQDLIAKLTKTLSIERNDNVLENEVFEKMTNFLTETEKLETITGKNWSEAQKNLRILEKVFIKDICNNYVPGGLKADWSPEFKNENIFLKDNIITPEKEALFKEYKETEQLRKNAFAKLKELRQKEYAELKKKWRSQRAEWTQNRYLLPRDRAKLISMSKVMQMKKEERIRSKYTQKRNEIRKEYPFIGWAGFLQNQARQGNKVAMNIWSNMGEMMPSTMDYEIDPEELLSKIKHRIDNTGNIIYTLSNAGTVKDSGRVIHFSPDLKSRAVAEKLAQRKYGPHFVQADAGKFIAGKLQGEMRVYTLPSGGTVREVDGAISFDQNYPKAKQAAFGLANRKFGSVKLNISERGIITKLKEAEKVAEKNKKGELGLGE